MNENILHHIWQFKLFDAQRLKTISGKSLVIKNQGVRNTNQGPDFSHAKIKIGETLWAGNVEIHCKTSDWYKHGHQHDRNYENVILHVVYEHDSEWNESIELLELKNVIPEGYLLNINRLFQTGLDYCLPHWKSIDDIHISAMLNKAVIEKLSDKKAEITQLLKQLNNDWDEAFYVYLVRYFGMKVNNEPFLRLAKQTPLKIIEKHADNLFQVEALLFGQSGLLYKYHESLYAQKLLKEYEFLKAKYNLDPMDSQVWKFSRMRPTAFPTVKIAQLAALLTKHTRLFRSVLQANSLKQLQELFTVSPSQYWQTHYTFGNESPEKNKKISANTVTLLTINAILPFAFAYADYTANETLKDKIVLFFESLPPESNRLIKHIKEHFAFANAFQTQGMLYLDKNYCQLKKCLDCGIGNKIITE
tara:strand:+ start:12385 stop:13638 length:1254 start_codon:yes stop_codon:yes gene_type:complete